MKSEVLEARQPYGIFISYFLVIASFAVAFFTPVDAKEIMGVVGFGSVVLGALVLRAWPAFYLGLTFFLMCLYFLLIPSWLMELPVHCLLVPALAASLILFLVHRPQLSWARIGRIDRSTLLLMIGTGIAAVIALLVWAQWSDNLGYGRNLLKNFSQVNFWILAGLGIPVFSLLMALAEEVLYRGIMLGTLTEITNSWKAALVIQALTYAAFHYARGFPNGNVGFVLVFLFGLALGLLKKRSRGLLAPYLVHVTADLVIGSLLLSL